MICVSIGRGRHRSMIAEARHVAEQGADLVELRLDYIRRAVNIKRLLANRRCPIIATCRREDDGGKWNASDIDRMTLLRQAIAEGVDYVDLEEDVAGQIPRYGKTKRIVSYHNFVETPEDVQSIHDRIVKLDPDIVKIATLAHHPHDNLRLLQLIENSKVPTVAFCMGEQGILSRLLSGRFGAPFTYATFHEERALAPGQLSYRQMTEMYRYTDISKSTAVYGVVADPVGHSLSPVIHNAAFQDSELDMVYIPFRVPLDELGSFLGDCPDLGIKGLSITIPHKEEVMQFLDQVDTDAATIGACNTAVFDGRQISGYNTDHQAAVDSLLRAHPKSGPTPLKGKTSLIMGSGGAAKSVAYGLTQLGSDVVITSRNEERTMALAERFNCRTIPWEERQKIRAGILINTTPIGMHPKVDESPYEKRHIDRGMVVFDTVYNPEQTLLVKYAREQNCRVITGVDMFIRQAELQFRHFTGQEAPKEVMRNQLKRSTGAARH
ncbi:MAG: shikimate dehydrogenase [Planctomycetota bacterium]|nr:shikimate dehydrogenase [Planctomycetota bacterium]